MDTCYANAVFWSGKVSLSRYLLRIALCREKETRKETRKETDAARSYSPFGPLPVECALLLENVFSYYRMCSLTIECVLLLWTVFSYYGLCSLTT